MKDPHTEMCGSSDKYVFSDISVRSLGNGSVNRTSTGASTTVQARLSVDYELAVTLADSLNGTLGCTSTASDAIISNLVSHD